MSYRLPPLNALRQFESAARQLSFRLAAEELHVTPSAISHGVQALEEALGTALFVRDRRGLLLTPAGAAYLPRVREGLDLLARAAEVLPPNAGGRRRLRLSVAVSFASRFLIPRLHRFHQAHPEVEILLDTVPRLVDFPRDGIDLAIRRGDGDWPDLISERLLGEALVPVCAPEVARQIGRPSDLKAQTLLHVTAPAEDWRDWLRLAGVGGLELDHGLRVDTIEMAWSAATQGLGVAIGRVPLLSPDLASGVLVAVLGPPVPGSVAYWLTSTPETLRRPEAAAFRDWLIAELEALGDAPDRAPA